MRNNMSCFYYFSISKYDTSDNVVLSKITETSVLTTYNALCL